MDRFKSSKETWKKRQKRQNKKRLQNLLPPPHYSSCSPPPYGLHLVHLLIIIVRHSQRVVGHVVTVHGVTGAHVLLRVHGGQAFVPPLLGLVDLPQHVLLGHTVRRDHLSLGQGVEHLRLELAQHQRHPVLLLLELAEERLQHLQAGEVHVIHSGKAQAQAPGLRVAVILQKPTDVLLDPRLERSRVGEEDGRIPSDHQHIRSALRVRGIHLHIPVDRGGTVHDGIVAHHAAQDTVVRLGCPLNEQNDRRQHSKRHTKVDSQKQSGTNGHHDDDEVASVQSVDLLDLIRVHQAHDADAHNGSQHRFG